MFGSSKTTLFWNEDLSHIVKINKYLKESGLLTKGVTDTIKNEEKEQKGGFIEILLGTLGASLDATLDEAVIRAVKDTIRAGEVTIRAGQNFNATSAFNKFWNINVFSKWT